MNYVLFGSTCLKLPGRVGRPFDNFKGLCVSQTPLFVPWQHPRPSSPLVKVHPATAKSRPSSHLGLLVWPLWENGKSVLPSIKRGCVILSQSFSYLFHPFPIFFPSFSHPVLCESAAYWHSSPAAEGFVSASPEAPTQLLHPWHSWCGSVTQCFQPVALWAEPKFICALGKMM